LTRQLDGHSQLEKTQTFLSGNATKFFSRFAIKRRLRIYQDAKESRLVLFVERIKRQLNTISEKLFELSLDRIVDSAEATHCLSFSGDFQGQTCRALRTDGCCLLHFFNF